MKKLINFYLLTSLCLLSSLLLFSCSDDDNNDNSGGPINKTKVKMILDLDTGIDDAMALAYAIASDEIELIGVVGTFGNVATNTGVQNTLDLLNLLNQKNIPVYKGSTKAFGMNNDYIPGEAGLRIHGKNGIGNVIIDKSPQQVEAGDGIDFIVESARKYGKNLMIVAVGPIPNITLAIQKEPDLGKIVKGIVIMGGAYQVKGNVSQYAEANIHNDPIAANELFISDTPFTMVGLDVTMQTKLTKKETQIWRDLGTKSGIAFADIVDYYIDAYGNSAPELAGCALHDPLAVGVAIHPELVKTIDKYLEVGISGEEIGRTRDNISKEDEKNPNAKICIEVDYDKYVNDFTKILTDLFKNN